MLIQKQYEKSDEAGGSAIIIEEAKETVLDFSKKQLKYYNFISF